MSKSTPIQFTIAPPPPSPNKMLRLHYFQRNDITHGIYTQVLAAVRAITIKRPVFGHRLIVIEAKRHAPRKMDPDNFIGSLKPVIDGLRQCGAIADDTVKQVQIGDCRQHIAKRSEARLVVTLRLAGD